MIFLSISKILQQKTLFPNRLEKGRNIRNGLRGTTFIHGTTAFQYQKYFVYRISSYPVTGTIPLLLTLVRQQCSKATFKRHCPAGPFSL